MGRVHISVAVIAWCSLAAPNGSAQTVAPDFQRQIRPLLADRCFPCHGPDAAQRHASLRLDLGSNAKTRTVLRSADGTSELLRRIESEDAEEKMPPAELHKPLTPQEISLLRRWIESGAEYRDHWAYVPPSRRAVPAVDDQSWPRGAIDRFLLNRMRREGMSPSPDADPRTLLRRLSFDLTGLPPSLEDVREFLKDCGVDESEGPVEIRLGNIPTDRYDQAVSRQVDRLLSSDRYGERMASFWFDLVRYADTVGYHGDQDHHISPYRDWVMDAFNDNMPFDRFTRAQLAGDLLPDSGIDEKIATGYNRMLQTSHEGGVQPREYLAIYGADRVRNLSAVWMGATIGCAQCHDHKYDPYTIRDFYSLQAFFADVDEDKHFKVGADAIPTKRPPEISVLTKRERQRIAELEAELAAWKKQSDDSGKADRIAAISRKVEQLKSAARMTMVTEAVQPREIRILPRGNWLDDSGEIVQPATPTFLPPIAAGNRRANRLDLANWLVDADKGIGGLTARVFVNRIWQLLFEVGISSTPEDFGAQGEAPVHPELLDWLAVEFVESGWNVKKLLRQIATSRAYRQSSIAKPADRERDPANRLCARQSRFRLPAEMIRDNSLAVSGLLVLEYGGPSVRPYQPEGYYGLLNFPKRQYVHDVDSRQWRRAVYMHWQRQFLHPMLKAFDAPRREECTARRLPSNTPQAALTLLNDPSFVEAARAFGARMASAKGADRDRIRRGFELATSRLPDDAELNKLADFLSDQRTLFQREPKRAEELTAIGLSKAGSEIDRAELAAWTMAARVMLNLDDAISRP